MIARMPRAMPLLVAALGALLAAPPSLAGTVSLSELLAGGLSATLAWSDPATGSGGSFEVPDESFGQKTDGSGDVVVSHLWNPAWKPELALEIKPSTLNPDPFIAWSISATNNSGAPMFFSFSFGTPLSPAVDGPNSVRSQISGGVTDATGDGVALSPQGGSHLQDPSVAPSASGARTALGVPTGGAFSGNTGVTETFSYPVDSAGFAAGPAGDWRMLFTTVSFTLSGAGDTVALTGNAVISPVPLPAALPLLLAGLGFLGPWARRPAAPGRRPARAQASQPIG